MNSDGFEGDYFIGSEIKKLVDIFSINHIIETGTFYGATTKKLAALCPTLTMEINPKFTQVDMPNNVELFKGDSVIGLKTYLPKFKDKNVLFYLDAHWEDECPLLEELAAIADITPNKSIIVIHDFQVPNKSEFGFDSYKGQDFTFDWIQSSLNKIYQGNFKYYYNYVVAGACRGVIYIFPT